MEGRRRRRRRKRASAAGYENEGGESVEVDETCEEREE